MESWRSNRLAFGIFLLPGTAWLVVFFTIPLVIIWIYSFALRGPQGQIILALNFENYLRAVEWIHLGIIWKSIWFAGATTAICLLIGFPLALGIAFASTRYKNVLLLLVILPFWTNLLIRTYAWIAILRTKGFANMGIGWIHDRLDDLFTLVGLPGLLVKFEPFVLLYNNTAVIIGLVYVALPFLVLPLYATLEKLDRSYLEASLDLGAGQWRTLFSITLPLALPGVVSGALLVFIISLGSFLTPNLLGGTSSLMIGNLVAQEFGPSRDWPFGSALSFVLMYATFLILWLRALVAARSKGVSY